MTIKQQGGIFGRNPKFNDVEVQSLSIAGDAVPDASTILVDGDIGTTVQGYDADTAKLDAAQTWTAAQTFDENIVMANGKGIDFSATAGTGTSELFDDYEEGNFDAAVKDDNGVLIAQTNSGRYVKIGDLVYITFEIFSSGPFTATGVPHIDLPFTAGSKNNSVGIMSYLVGNGSVIAIEIRQSSTIGRFATVLNNAYSNSATGASFGGGAIRIYGSATYKV